MELEECPMTINKLPQAQGLYRPEFEHDACGIGLYAHLNGRASHDIVEKGLHMLDQLEHRGGQGSDPDTSDGVGIMVQIPHDFFQSVCTFTFPEKGHYGVGMIFFPQDEKERAHYESEINRIVEEEGQQLLGWRTVPVDSTHIGPTGRESQPYVRQVFIAKNENVEEGLPFERKLYVIRKRAEKVGENTAFYFASLSSQTIVYKGLMTPSKVSSFYKDLKDERFTSGFSLVHSRFSTNTFPSWERAHPNRYLIHNGEINTLRGNINWMRAREQQFISEAFGDDLDKVMPLLDINGSDSSILDNAFEFFTLAGRKPAHTAMMLIPEPWARDENMEDDKKAFYQYHSCLMEPWDGPTAVVFTDGNEIGAILDRNGLRPARYYVTKDDYLILSSEVGVIDVDPENVLYKDRLSPGKMLLLNLEEGRIISDRELKEEMISEHPYREWLNEQMIEINDLEQAEVSEKVENLVQLQKAFGYTYEEVSKNIIPMVTEGKDPIGSMGLDTPLAVLSNRSHLLYNYFKQLFAQVTNPPIDAIREEIVTSTMTLLGQEGNILHPDKSAARRIMLDAPFLSNEEVARLKETNVKEFKTKTLSLLFKEDIEKALETLCGEVDKAMAEGNTIIVLSDRGVDEHNMAMPTLLAGSAVHQYLVEKGTRTAVSLVAETAEAREVHHFAVLIGYGIDAINPYLAYETLREGIKDGVIKVSYDKAVATFNNTASEGVVKVMSKVGVSTVQSYRGAQIFEAVGIGEDVINRYFTGTASQLSGVGLDVIEQEVKMRHEAAFVGNYKDETLEAGSELQWRRNGEHHAFNPQTIHTLQHACRTGNYELFKKYSKMADDEQLTFLRNAFSFNKKRKSISIDEVESVDSIVKRFKTGAMSFGSLSEEAHSTLAIAMNRLGGKSNSGEGGEDPARFTRDENGDYRRSAIKQVASGRFGVNSHYLVNADELQIKMAQGAKPGEGGQLPGTKVYPWVAEVRGSTPGVSLISPPPHHDIYSIEDLAQLIHDLKNANSKARISVKLVSKAGVGTIAAGVAKAVADVIVISGYDGGTGASPKTSIKHTGLPWELGLTEAHQTLMMNKLRSRVILETDGKLMTGRDVVMAALFGAEEYGFATAPLVVLGCIMMRACHLDTCPVGVATQNPELRKKFLGDPDHIVNFMRFIAQEVREIMAELGFRTVEEMVGQTEVLEVSERTKSHWKAKHLDLTKLLYKVEGEHTRTEYQNHKLDQSLDVAEILPKCERALNDRTQVDLSFNIRNVNRVVGTIVGSEVTRRFGEKGLPEDTITLRFNGSAGQSFGAFVPKGMTLNLQGDANDYVGKGLSGGKIIVRAPEVKAQAPEDNVIAGNVSLIGATAGEAYIEGRAGERFCVRNSGAHAVVEGVGDHGCEYMTGGRAVIIGAVGKNFGAGMSGGVAYVLPDDVEHFDQTANKEMVYFETLQDEEDIKELKAMLTKHMNYTGSVKATQILAHWEESVAKFVKVIPKDYKRMLQTIEAMKASGMEKDEAVMAAFKANSSNKSEKVDETLQTIGS